MLTGERRGVSARRGMTVLGKIPAVPKPINLPSQRLENRGLDPNVEIVPRGSVTWGSAGRSPPSSNTAWGNATPASSPPVSSGAWGSKAAAATPGSSSGGGAWAGLGNVSRPSSAGSGTRPSSAGSIGPVQQHPDPSSTNNNSSTAWGTRPSSASGALGQAQQPPASLTRPRSADTSRPAASLTRFADPSTSPVPPSAPAWGGAAAARRLAEEPHQASRFTLMRVDFPTLGSEKNPDLRPQHSNSVQERPGSVEEKVPAAEERPPPTPPGPSDDVSQRPAAGYGGQERDAWRRDVGPFAGPPAMSDTTWLRDGPPPIPSYGGQGPPPETWRRDTAHSGSSLDDNWRRGGAPLIGPFGPHQGPGRFPHDGAGFMHQPRFGPAPYGQGGPGPGGYGRHSDIYGNAGPLLRPAAPLRPGMFPGPVAYDGFYGPPGYGNMEEREMMLGMGPQGIYGGYPHHQGPPFEAFGRYPHAVVGQGHRHIPNNNPREHNDTVGEGYQEGGSYNRDLSMKEGGGHKEGRGHNDASSVRSNLVHDLSDSSQGVSTVVSSTGSENQRQCHRGGLSGHHPSHRDWGAAASSDEPMDFSKPVFEEEVSSASPNGGKPLQGLVHSEATSPLEGVPNDTVKTEVGIDKGVNPGEGPIDGDESKEGRGLGLLKGETAEAPWKTEEGSPLNSKGLGRDNLVEGPVARDQPGRKAINSGEMDGVYKVVVKDSTTSGRDRGSNRVGNHAKQFSASNAVTAAAVAAALRPGQHSTATVGKSSILGNAPPGITAIDVLFVPETFSLPTPDKQAAVTSPATCISDSDGQKSSEKVRILKRLGEGGPDSPSSDTTASEPGLLDVAVGPTPAGNEHVTKDVLKTKTKATSHDGEKEWRPKVVNMDTSSRPSSSSATAQVLKSTAVPVPAAPAVSGPSETAESEPEIAPPPNSYDYEAQRARMKEMAAQRARQLQKEEEERIKEQKAKARAKLEELNRRTTIPQSVPTEELAVEISQPLNDLEEVAPEAVAVPLEAEPVVEIGSSSGSRRSIRNEHKRDRKPSGRKLSTGEATKGNMNGAPSQTPPLLPSPNVPAAPLLPSPISTQEPPGQPPKAQQQSWHKSRAQQKQPTLRPDDVDRTVSASAVEISTPGENGGCGILPPVSQDTDLENMILPTTGSMEGASANRKKKSNRNSRNRLRQEGPAIGVDAVLIVESSAGPSADGSSGSDLPADTTQTRLHVGASPNEVGKDPFPSQDANAGLPAGDVLTGEGDSIKTNGDVVGKRLPRKPQGARRPVRSDRGSQDVRITDKPHASDSKVWAPVRSPMVAGSIKLGDSEGQTGEQKEDVSAQQRGRLRRAELERYTPKPVIKQHQETSQQQPGVVPDRPLPMETSMHAPLGVVSGNSQPSFAPTQLKSNNETKPVDPGSKVGRVHGSWRQRASGNSERGRNGVKDGHPAQHPRPQSQVEAGHQRQHSEQKSGSLQPPLSLNQSPSDHPVAPSQLAPSPVQRSEREQHTSQTPYQPPRAVPASGHCGHGPPSAESKGHHTREQGVVPPHPRSGGTPLDRPLSSDKARPQHHPRSSSANHAKQQTYDREYEVPNQQVFAGPHLQPKSLPGTASKPWVQPALDEREQQQTRSASQQSNDGGDHKSHRRYDREQTTRPSMAQQQPHQRGQTHWQQAGRTEGSRSATTWPQPTEEEQPVPPQHVRPDIPKQQAHEVPKPIQGQQQNKTTHPLQRPAALSTPGPKESGPRVGEPGTSPPALRSRDHGHARRGHFGGRSSARNVEMEPRREPHIPKQRQVIDATGGAVPSQVGG